MDSIINIFKNRTVAYVLIVLTLISIGAAVFLGKYSNLFQNKPAEAVGNQTVDIANVEIKTLNKAIFESEKFLSLQKVESATVDMNSLQIGKKDPFLPD